MISLTRKSDYALVAMVGIVERHPQPVSARELAERLKLPLGALRGILKDLARRGMLSSTLGASGGYRLARDASGITLAEIIDTIEGPVRLTVCCSPGAEQPCRLEDSCRIKAVVRSLNTRLAEFLGMVTLDDLAREELPAVLTNGAPIGDAARANPSTARRANTNTSHVTLSRSAHA